MHCVWPLIVSLVAIGIGAMMVAEGKKPWLLTAGAVAAAVSQSGYFDEWCGSAANGAGQLADVRPATEGAVLM
jgi:hypothetical protein